MKKKLFKMNSEEDWNEYFICGGRKPQNHWVCVDTETGEYVDEKRFKDVDYREEV